MNSWRESILKELLPGLARILLVSDPDGLTFDEEIVEEISIRGFELIEYSDSISFRYELESSYRDRRDKGEQAELIVVIKDDASGLQQLPYDILNISRKIYFSLNDIFPDLSCSVVSYIDHAYFDSLFDAYKQYAPGNLGVNATKDFILRHVFEFAPEMIKDDKDLLRVLLRRHYKGQKLPDALNRRCIELLKHNRTFDGWPLESIVADRDAFFTFLQERWQLFIDRKLDLANDMVKENQAEYSMTYEGIEELPFDHHDIKVYIDNLFTDGFLHAVYHDTADTVDDAWYKVGIITDRLSGSSRRLNKLVERIKGLMPDNNAKHHEWLNFARVWAELLVLKHEQQIVIDPETKNMILELQCIVDCRFIDWLTRRYASLVNLPPTSPVMLHHIPRYLSRKIETSNKTKVAMIVVDGLSLDQWLIAKDELKLNNYNNIVKENTIFAWAPTLTAVSRQAAFSGKPPNLFPDSISTTNKDDAQWRNFWMDQGLNTDEVLYKRGLGEDSLDSLEEALSHPRVKAVGLVIDKVDNIMHGMELGTAGMHNQVRQWVQRPYFSKLINLLLENHYEITITSDHGNIEAKGFGVPKEGVLAEVRGERVRIYSNQLLRDKYKTDYKDTLEWPSICLPPNYLPLIAGNRHAFVLNGKTIVGHGGVCIEELIVPLIEIEGRK